VNLSFRLEERKDKEVTAVRTSYMFSFSTFRYLIGISHTASPGSVEMRAGACSEVVAEVLVNYGLEAYRSAWWLMLLKCMSSRLLCWISRVQNTDLELWSRLFADVVAHMTFADRSWDLSGSEFGT